MTIPVLPYAPPPPITPKWVRVVNWLALECGLPFWLVAMCSLASSRHIYWSLFALGLSSAGTALGLVAIIATRARSAVAWWGFSLSLVPIVLTLFFIATTH